MQPVGRPQQTVLEIGLLNNMPDVSLHETERQFSGLLAAAAGRRDVRLRFYSIPETPRGVHTRAYMNTLYSDFDSMFEAGLDGLIVTSAEPRGEDLTDEPYWERLTQVVDWAETNLHGSYWSDVAAHAAVLHLDGVSPVSMAVRRRGVFGSQPVVRDPLLSRLSRPFRMPHARQHGLVEQSLMQAGYRVLTLSADAGVDVFVRRGRSLMMFGQGHPEYDADTLLKDYCRDVDRFLWGRNSTPPDLPTNYLNFRTRRALHVAARRALRAAARRRPDPDLTARFEQIAATAQPRAVWRSAAVTLFRNWLSQVAAGKAASRSRRRPRPTDVHDAHAGF
jgi:homoserine O-succinyltransferase